MATIKEIKEQLLAITSLDDPRWQEYLEDSRAGVQTAIKQRQKAIQKCFLEEERLEQMLHYEKALYKEGKRLIAGIDEVGRGPLAGPVVAAAVILPENCKIAGLNDSKKSQNTSTKPFTKPSVTMLLLSVLVSKTILSLIGSISTRRRNWLCRRRLSSWRIHLIIS